MRLGNFSGLTSLVQRGHVCTLFTLHRACRTIPKMLRGRSAMPDS